MAEKRHLSHTGISTFCGNVLPLRLLGGEEYGQEKITWRTDNKKAVKTRFIRLQILSSTGNAWGEEETAGSPLTIGEITFWN